MSESEEAFLDFVKTDIGAECCSGELDIILAVQIAFRAGRINGLSQSIRVANLGKPGMTDPYDREAVY